MGRYLAGRLLSAVPVLFVVSLISFVIIFLVPGDAASEIAGPTAGAAEIARVRTQLGLDRPYHEQLFFWYGNLLRGDLGQSFLLQRPVTQAIIERLPVTLSLTALALTLTVLIGVATGVAAAARQGSWIDQTLMTGCLVGLSLPDFWLGLVMIYLFAVVLGWLPTGGYIDFATDSIAWLRNLTLPALVLALTQVGLLARMTRSAMLEVLRQDYIRTARAKGLPRFLVIGKHALTNVMVPVVTVIGLSVGILLGGAVVIESVFALPGIGRLIVGAILRRDYPVIQGGLLLTAAVFVFVNILVDLLYAWFDPRVRYEH
jgi:peptide/nickel transport system permease protein